MVRLGGAASPTYISVFRGLQAHFLRYGIELDWVLYSDYDALVEAFDSGSGKASIAGHSRSIRAPRSPTVLRLSTPGRAFHSASSRLPLSGAACNSAFDATAISPSLTVAGASRHSVIPSLPMM